MNDNQRASESFVQRCRMLAQIRRAKDDREIAEHWQSHVDELRELVPHFNPYG